VLAPFRRLHPVAQRILFVLAIKFAVSAVCLYVQWELSRPRVRVVKTARIKARVVVIR